MPIHRKILLAAAVVSGFNFFSAAQAGQIAGLNRPNVIPNQYIVVFKDASKSPLAARSTAEEGPAPMTEHLRSKYRGTVKRMFRHSFRGAHFEMSLADAMKLANDPGVELVEADAWATLSATQSGAPWGLDRVDQQALPLSGAYNYPDKAGAGVHVYVVDTGLRTTHAAFDGRVGGGVSFMSDSLGVSDCHGHGTHVAGIIGATVSGIAKKAVIHPVRAIDCQGAGTTSTVVAAMDWIAANRVMPAVVNVSLRFPASQALDLAVDRLAAAGVSTAVAAGNEGVDACTVSPARAVNALTVGASDSSDQRASFSNQGACVKLYAPGVNIVSASHLSDTGTVSMSGTSMSSPHVAGAAALYLSIAPAATPAEVRSAMVNNGLLKAVYGVASGAPNVLLNTSFLTRTYTRFNVAGGVPNGRVFLSGPADGSKADLWNVVDASGRQSWSIELSADNVSYNIVRRIGGVGPRMYLSAHADGTKVDLWHSDDGSGRQRWQFVGNNIMVQGGVPGPRRYLSTSADGTRVDLWTNDDGSGRQKWVRTTLPQ